MRLISNLIFSLKHPTLIFPSYLLRRNMSPQCNFSRCLLFFYKGCDWWRSNRNLAVIPNTNILFLVETIRDIIIQIVLQELQMSLWLYNFNGFDPCSILNRTNSEDTASASGLDITWHRIKLVMANGDRNVEHDSFSLRS
jgi:hypothetical protein